MSKSKNATKILIIDDHPLFREGLQQLIDKQDDLCVIGQAGSMEEGLEKIEKLKPDFVTVDVSLPAQSGIELVKQVNSQYEKLPVLVMSMHDESMYAERVVRAGAKGYIMKAEATEKVADAIRKILKGQIYLSEKMTERMLQKQLAGKSEDVSSIETLSDRELEVFEMIGNGQTTAAIAEKLHLSVKTIETYRANIKVKLDLEDNAKLIQHAVQWVQCSNVN